MQAKQEHKYINISSEKLPKSLNKRAIGEKGMDKKLVSVLVGITVIAAVALAITYIFSEKPAAKEYSDNPADWAKQGTIDVEQATKGTSYINEIGQQYNDAETSTVFELEGYYKGNYFNTEYIDENSRTKMKLTNEMKPNDGIIEGFMTERKDEKTGKWLVDIFVDADWKKQVGTTNIYWGVMYRHEKKLVFSEISPGIYHDQVIDDSDRLLENARIRTFGIIVGDVTPEETEGKTLMKLV
jgi:flagellar basal body-associated protein FliL